ncbi:MAG: bifunctional oligoribonuclease/PAP phosphatase NrnA [Candidatus Omnitrophota bacterium]
MSLKKIIAAIKKQNNFLVTAHTNLEGDAIGSEMAFYMLLKYLGKNAIVTNSDRVPAAYRFLPLLENIRKFRKGRFVPFDCLVLLDCSDLHRAGGVGRLNLEGKSVINIDHHTSNGYFGDVNWVLPHISSASEMVYILYRKLGVPFNRDIATLLYAGMVSDTGSFRYSNTTSSTHKAAAELIDYGLDVRNIYRRIYEDINFNDMRLLNKIALSIKRDTSGKIVWCLIPMALVKKNSSLDLSEQVLGFCRAVKGAEVAVLFKENLGTAKEVRVNLRSQGKVDVNAIAAFFGGGGHKTASGCTMKGRTESIMKKVLAKVRQALVR